MGMRMPVISSCAAWAATCPRSLRGRRVEGGVCVLWADVRCGMVSCGGWIIPCDLRVGLAWGSFAVKRRIVWRHNHRWKHNFWVWWWLVSGRSFPLYLLDTAGKSGCLFFFRQAPYDAGCGPPQFAHWGWFREVHSLWGWSPEHILQRSFPLQFRAMWPCFWHLKHCIADPVYSSTRKPLKPRNTRAGRGEPGLNSKMTERRRVSAMTWFLVSRWPDDGQRSHLDRESLISVLKGHTLDFPVRCHVRTWHARLDWHTSKSGDM